MATKLSLKIGDIHFDYEGGLEFTKEDIFELFQKTSIINESKPQIKIQESLPVVSPNISHNAESSINMSMQNIAHKVSVSSASDLVVAACAFLSFVQGKDHYDRKEILETMKKAHGFYKESMSSNLSKSLRTLLGSDKLRQVANNEYTLEAKYKEDLRRQLAH
jgi:hypothetical protein